MTGPAPRAPLALSGRRVRGSFLRPGVLGLFAFGYAFAVAWMCYGRLLRPDPATAEHHWWHGGYDSTANAGQDLGGAGQYLLLTVAALYLLLPLLALAAVAVRRLPTWTGRPTGQVFDALAFAVLGIAASAVVAVPVSALAVAMAPGSWALWPALTDDLVGVLRLCAPIGLLLAAVVGVPWNATTTATHIEREPQPC